MQDRRGCLFIFVGMRDFKNWVNVMNIMELFLEGRKYICSRKNLKSKIDRVFVDLEQIIIFLELRLQGLNRLIFDYFFLLVEGMKINWGSKLFRLLDVWFIYLRFSKMVKEEWKNMGDIQI